MVYLKLAIFYEDYASRDWLEAATNAESCYAYYLDNIDPEDVAILTRLGNLLVREHKSEDAISIYNRILSIDPSLYNVWFNKAHAELKVGDYDEAFKSLKQTIALNPTIIAANHMLKALSDDEATKITKTDESYVIDLYDTYSDTYDEHGKKLLYSAPRVIRQEMAKVYKAREKLLTESVDGDSDESLEIVTSPPMNKISLTPLSTCGDHTTASTDTANPTASCDDHDHDPNECGGQVSFMNRKLDILDLGCGTGLAGAWLKDYARTLVGVDISDKMVSIAKKKGLYEELHVNSIQNFLNKLDGNKNFDLVVAADVLSYIGDLSDVIPQVSAEIYFKTCSNESSYYADY